MQCCSHYVFHVFMWIYGFQYYDKISAQCTLPYTSNSIHAEKCIKRGGPVKSQQQDDEQMGMTSWWGWGGMGENVGNGVGMGMKYFTVSFSTT